MYHKGTVQLRANSCSPLRVRGLGVGGQGRMEGPGEGQEDAREGCKEES